MEIRPEEEGKTVCLDLGENNTVLAWFSGTHSSLSIETHFIV